MSTFIVKRLHEGEDLKQVIELIVKEDKIEAGCLISLVGSLHIVTLRMAGAKIVKKWDAGHYEIVSVTGTVSCHGSHIHLSVSDEAGNVFGGHLKEGCVVNTTVEVVIAILPGYQFLRTPDAATGFDELKVVKTK